ncbi:uncharacterized protein LOC116288988 [Actinia tenebrosa]|uniref:Uncharacterized protein LOC116288988 n=1 Tax=Actinia tenebrosa TaxID=6105 RepID=A0A6P8H892_ACTTE|nr:uncharacterized protein LOC116288988 [Actinia tenebrosa]
MITVIVSAIAYLVESCTGVVLEEQLENTSIQEFESLCVWDASAQLEDFTKFDPKDAIFQEFDPPRQLEDDPQAWKKSLPTFLKSFWECLKTVLLIQTVAGCLIGLFAVGIYFFNLLTLEWCNEETPHWNKMPIQVQRLRVTTAAIEGIFVQMWDFFCIILIFPLSLIKDLHLLTLNLLAGFIELAYRLFLQLYGIYKISWMAYPLNALFCIVVLINNFLLARHFSPHSLGRAIRIDFILSAQFLLGMPVTFFILYELFPLYVSQEERIKIVIAGMSPFASVIPKVICRLGAQSLNGIIHPGTAHVLVTVIYGASAVVFRVLQAELTSINKFIACGIAHAFIDLLERITITMRDNIWGYLYRLVRRQTSRQPKYISPRSRRLIADISIQIMMQEATALITTLGFINVFQYVYSTSKPFTDYELVFSFFIRVGLGLSIDLVFNVISLLIQTRVMNIAVNRVWKKKWRYHLLVNTVLLFVSVLYFSDHLFGIVKSALKEGYITNMNDRQTPLSRPSASIKP